MASEVTCPQCGAINEPGSRFCGDCGKPLPSGTLPDSGRLTARPAPPGGAAPAGTAPAEPAPGGTAPMGTAPVAPVPGGTAPMGTAPVAPVPGGTAPVGTAPVAPVPGGTAPVGTTPIAPVPGATAPMGTTPIAPVPGATAPMGTVPLAGDYAAPAPAAGAKRGMNPLVLGAAAVVVLAVVGGGIFLATRPKPGGSSVHLDARPTTSVGTETSAGKPAAPTQPGTTAPAQPATGGGTQPSSGGTPPSDGGTQPSSGGTPPSSGGTQPSSGGTQPSSGGTQPSSGGTQPSSGGTQPSSGGTQPSSGGTQPSSGGTQPSSGGTQPSSGGTQPSSGGTQPSQPQQPAATAPPPAPPAPASNWKIIGQGAIGVPFSFFEPWWRGGRTEVFAGRNDAGGRAVLYFVGWDGSALRVLKNANHSGEIVDVTTGDMMNWGEEQAIAIFKDTLAVFDEDLETEDVPNPGIRHMSIGDFDADGEMETMALVTAGGSAAYGLFRFDIYADGKALGVINGAPPDAYFQKGVTDARGRYNIAVYREEGGKSWIANLGWNSAYTSLVDGPSLPLPAPANCFYAVRHGGTQYMVVSFRDGSIILYRLSGSTFSQVDRLSVTGNQWCVMAGDFTGTGLEIMAFDSAANGKYAIFGRK